MVRFGLVFRWLKMIRWISCIALIIIFPAISHSTVDNPECGKVKSLHSPAIGVDLLFRVFPSFSFATKFTSENDGKTLNNRSTPIAGE